MVKQKVVENAVGELRDYEKRAGAPRDPEPRRHRSPSRTPKEFYDWHEDFVIKGNNGDDKEKGGTLEYLTPEPAGRSVHAHLQAPRHLQADAGEGGGRQREHPPRQGRDVLRGHQVQVQLRRRGRKQLIRRAAGR